MRGSEIYMYIYIVKDIYREREKKRETMSVFVLLCSALDITGFY